MVRTSGRTRREKPFVFHKSGDGRQAAKVTDFFLQCKAYDDGVKRSPPTPSVTRAENHMKAKAPVVAKSLTSRRSPPPAGAGGFEVRLASASRIQGRREAAGLTVRSHVIGGPACASALPFSFPPDSRREARASAARVASRAAAARRLEGMDAQRRGMDSLCHWSGRAAGGMELGALFGGAACTCMDCLSPVL